MEGVSEPFELRLARPEDAPAMAESVRLGFESYRDWMPRGWDPPRPADLEAGGIALRLEDPGAWATVALAGGEPAGHAGFAGARERDETRTPIPGLAHLWSLFVRPPWWGTGLAARLNAAVTAEATRQGYEAMRLFTPAGSARGRAFYEREGWEVHGEPYYEALLGMDLVQYRRDLPASPP